MGRKEKVHLPSSHLLMLRLNNCVRHVCECRAKRKRWREKLGAVVRGQLELIKNRESLGSTRRQNEGGRSEGPCCEKAKASVVGFSPASSFLTYAFAFRSGSLPLCSVNNKRRGKFAAVCSEASTSFMSPRVNNQVIKHH